MNEAKERQEAEMAAMAAIFQQDFQSFTPSSDAQTPQFKIRITPPPGVTEKSFASVWLILRYSKGYPLQVPAIEIEKIEGLSDEHIEHLSSLLVKRAKELVGEEMVYELVELTRDFLLSHNTQTLSFYEEMVLHRKKEEQEANEREQRLLQEEQERKRKEDMALEEQIRREYERKEKTLRSARKKLTSDWTQPLNLDEQDEFPSYFSDSSDEELEAQSSTYQRFARKVQAKPQNTRLSIREEAEKDVDKKHDKDREQEKDKVKEQEKEERQGRKDGHSKIAEQPIRWKRRNTLGKGTFGEVILGMNLGTHKLMAVKEIDFQSAPNPNEAMDIVTAEIGSLKFLHHQHLVSYYGTEKEGTTLRIFMEFVSGATSITSLLDDNSRLEETMLRKYTRQILEGLSCLHDHSIVHGDIKCLNMLLDHKGNVKLSDFGCSNAKIKALLSGSQPAQFQLADLLTGKQDDVYSLGLALIQLAGGAFTTADPGARPGVHPPPIPTNLSRDAKDFLRSCLKKNRKERATVEALLQHPFVADVSTTNKWHLPGSPPSSHAMANRPQNNDPEHSAEILVKHRNTTSRYKTDFVELEELGRGGFGSVVKVKNILDERLYAVKKIKLDTKDHGLNQKILREVTTLSRLNHQYVVRYYQAWTELDDSDSDSEGSGDSDMGSDGTSEHLLSEGESSEDLSGDQEDWLDAAASLNTKFGIQYDEQMFERYNPENELDSEQSPQETIFTDDDDMYGKELMDSIFTPSEDSTPSEAFIISRGRQKRLDKPVRETLYIQMEYCPRNTLKTEIEKRLTQMEEQRWRLFRQILEGLNHIHLQGIIHRDLKPANIFLDSNGDIKIGDFGLATTGGGRGAKMESQTSDSRSFNQAAKDSLTVGVGTPFYCSPEQQKEGMHYDQKVDLYSLGIILFEMTHQMSTGMERVEVLSTLRSSLTFPIGFEDKYPMETELIRWLLQEDPNARPTTMELLRSDLLPPKLEEEILKEAVRTITTPGTTIFGELVERLFSLVPDPHLDYTYDSHTNSKWRNTGEEYMKERVVDMIIMVFKRHGSVFLQTPLLIPKAAGLDTSEAAWLLDDTGGVVQLPTNLTIPFARFVAHAGIAETKRHCISRVYRKNPAGGQPRELLECAFDIVGPPTARNVQDAETLKILCEILDMFIPQLGQYLIKISSHVILGAILDVCEFPKGAHARVCGIVEKMAKKMYLPGRQLSLTPSSLASRGGVGPFPSGIFSTISRLLLKIDGVTQKSVDVLQQFLNLRGEVEETLNKLSGLLRTHKKGMEGINDMRMLQRYLKALRVPTERLVFDVSLVHMYPLHDGLVFQALLPPGDIIALGGRYDSLVAKFSPPNTLSTEPVAAVGINLALAKLLTYYYTYERKRAKKDGLRLPICETDVYVCSVGRPMVEECMDIAQELWTHGINAEFAHTSKKELEELWATCRWAGVGWMVILKERTYDRGRMVKVKDVARRTEVDVHRTALVSHILFLLQRGGSSAGFSGGASVSTAGGRKQQPATSRHHATSLSGDSADLLQSGEARDSSVLPTKKLSNEAFVAPSTNPKGPSGPSKNVVPASTKGSLQIDNVAKVAQNVLDVIILNTDMHSKKRKSIATEANRTVGFRTANCVNPRITKIIATELPHNVLKEVVGCPSPQTMHQPLQKFKRHSEELNRLRNYINSQGKAFPMLFLYSIPEQKFEVLLLR